MERIKCCICLDDIETNTGVNLICRYPFKSGGVSLCGHIFHKKCIEEYEKNSTPPFKCPLCRKIYALMSKDDTDVLNEITSMLNDIGDIAKTRRLKKEFIKTARKMNIRFKSKTHDDIYYNVIMDVHDEEGHPFLFRAYVLGIGILQS